VSLRSGDPCQPIIAMISLYSASPNPFKDLPSQDDRTALIVFRSEHTFLLLNRYPYNPGHLLLHQFIQKLAASSEPSEINLVTGPTWAERWHFSEETVYRADLYNRNLRGQLLSTFRMAKTLLKKKDSQSIPNTSNLLR